MNQMLWRNVFILKELLNPSMGDLIKELSTNRKPSPRHSADRPRLYIGGVGRAKNCHLTYTAFDTVRKLYTTFSNTIRTASEALKKSDKGLCSLIWGWILPCFNLRMGVPKPTEYFSLIELIFWTKNFKIL